MRKPPSRAKRNVPADLSCVYGSSRNPHWLVTNRLRKLIFFKPAYATAKLRQKGRKLQATRATADHLFNHHQPKHCVNLSIPASFSVHRVGQASNYKSIWPNWDCKRPGQPLQLKRKTRGETRRNRCAGYGRDDSFIFTTAFLFLRSANVSSDRWHTSAGSNALSPFISSSNPNPTETKSPQTYVYPARN